jgi:hypothetical protein
MYIYKLCNNFKIAKNLLINNFKKFNGHDELFIVTLIKPEKF